MGHRYKKVEVGGWESDPGLPLISQRLRVAPGQTGCRGGGEKPRNHQEAVRKRASEVGGGAPTAGGI